MKQCILAFISMLYLYACFPSKLDGDVWTQAASAPVPLAKLFPESETLCIQFPYGFPEEMEAALGAKVEGLTMLDNEGLAIWWLFDKNKKSTEKIDCFGKKGCLRRHRFARLPCRTHSMPNHF